MNNKIKIFHHDRIFTLLLIAIAVIFFYMIGKISDTPGTGELATATYPRVILGAFIFIAILQFVFPKKGDEKPVSFPIKGLLSILLIAVYIYLLDKVGYFLLTPLVLFILPLLAGYRQYLAIAISVIFVTAVLYGIFKLVLNIPLPAGFLGA
ncbi:hypothetical protein GCM10009112_27480 [Marinomonas arenicola]|uniref:tripartite tricarboxylate transporter TctB family protein n=1 Tax=Marinomonas TaxID=28253 RepID=UPI0010567462|nr:tripartite tricarboxylate transporter TctB family protein [Marinomonas sp. KMM3893]